MLYKSHQNNLPIGKPIWGFAYKVDNETNRAVLKQTPVLGIIDGKSSYHTQFTPFSKTNPKQLAKSKTVNASARTYADTEQEAIDAYNELVQKRIDTLNALIIEANNDFLPIKA